MKHNLLLIILLIWILLPCLCLSQQADIENLNYSLEDICPLDSVLGLINLSIEDLGYHPQHYWISYPHPDQIPYTLPVFSDLFAQPQFIYPYIRQAAREFQVYSDSQQVDSNPQFLYKLSHHLGINRIYTGFRSYRSNLELFETSGDSSEILTELRLLEKSLDYVEEISLKWGYLADSGQQYAQWRQNRNLWFDCFNNNSRGQKYYAILLYNLAETVNQLNLGLRNVDRELIISYLSNCQSDDPDQLRLREDIYDKIDFASLWYGSLKLSELAGYLVVHGKNSELIPDTTLSLFTPLGQVIIGGSGEDSFICGDEPILAMVDWGGSDYYLSKPDSGNFYLILLLDWQGDDIYQSVQTPGLACGILGISILVDVEGNDHYTADRNSWGWADLGFSALYDLDGDDYYSCGQQGLGASYSGVGILADFKGEDQYSIYQEGIGFSAYGGIGICADREGDDFYYAEPEAEKAGLEGDYHSGGKILSNLAMGAGWGRRADMTDGHCYGGGLGMLIDLEGDDDYYAGNWAQGVGYWLGMGFLYDGKGNDIYQSCYFATASGAHYAMGAMIDEGGNDFYQMWGDSVEVPEWGWAGAGISFGWDYVIALLVNLGGDDFYQAKKIALGCSQIRSNALFIDISGDDCYQFPQQQQGMGSSDFRDYYVKPFYCFNKSIGIFIDQGGEDKYLNYLYCPDQLIPSSIWSNNSFWLNPESTYLDCYGVGIDLP
ncbi:MAG: hypothetical protein APR63_12150 [Desulfuromonas sp. SDB]|nr:MAG: hypothetical protein APR63_12150 [Desulfuromonas sp. SDB]